MTEEKYLIGNKEFVIREDLSFNELEKVSAFTESWKPSSGNSIVSKRKYTNDEVIDLIKMILTPIDGSDKNEFDWGNLTPQQATLIIADFAKKKATENFIINQASTSFLNVLEMQTESTKV